MVTELKQGFRNQIFSGLKETQGLEYKELNQGVSRIKTQAFCKKVCSTDKLHLKNFMVQ